MVKNNFTFINKTKQKIPRRYFLFVLKNFLKNMNIKKPIELNLIFIGKKRIQSLNYKYRKKNMPTDVLSFPIDITKPKQKPRSEKIILGDIFICPHLVKTGELQETFLHGLLHLVGYDHEKNEEEWKSALKSAY